MLSTARMAITETQARCQRECSGSTGLFQLLTCRRPGEQESPTGCRAPCDHQSASGPPPLSSRLSMRRNGLWVSFDTVFLNCHRDHDTSELLTCLAGGVQHILPPPSALLAALDFQLLRDDGPPLGAMLVHESSQLRISLRTRPQIKARTACAWLWITGLPGTTARRQTSASH